MTPKEKAIELYLKYYHNMYAHWDILECEQVAKGCALIAVDEILWEIIKYSDNSKKFVVENSIYWQEVKNEIELL